MSKLDRYVEQRLWNNKLRNGRQITTVQVMKELKAYYHLTGDEKELEERLREIIRRARRRVHKKTSKMTKNIEMWSRKLDLPISVIEKWAKEGLVNRQNIETVADILEDYRTVMKSAEKSHGAKQHSERDRFA